MSTNHPAVAALPTIGAPDKALLRNLLTGSCALTVTNAAAAADLVAQDPVTGALGLDILCDGRIFHVDLTDTTSAHDGVTVLVTSDGYRYKLASQTDVMVWSALSMALTAPPVSPSNGDSYLVPAGATGAWAGKADYVAVKTARGWEFVLFGIGRLLYIEDIDAYYRRNASGVWTAGLGASALGAGSVNILNVLGANASFVIKVENQTTNAPPASPTAPTAYIIGPSPTGAWAGNAGKLAICLVNGSFTIITPSAGDTVYDKSAGNSYRFNGTAWISSVGAWLYFNSVFTADSSSTTNTISGADYAYSDTTAPLQDGTQNCRLDSVTLARAALRSGAKLRFHYSARFEPETPVSANTTGTFTVALFKDAISAAIAWKAIPYAFVNSSTHRFDVEFSPVVTATDVSSHTYRAGIMNGPGGIRIASLSHRTFTIEEAS